MKIRNLMLALAGTALVFSVRRIIPDYRRERYFRFSGIHGR